MPDLKDEVTGFMLIVLKVLSMIRSQYLSRGMDWKREKEEKGRRNGVRTSHAATNVCPVPYCDAC